MRWPASCRRRHWPTWPRSMWGSPRSTTAAARRVSTNWRKGGPQARFNRRGARAGRVRALRARLVSRPPPFGHSSRSPSDSGPAPRSTPCCRSSTARPRPSRSTIRCANGTSARDERCCRSSMAFARRTRGIMTCSGRSTSSPRPFGDGSKARPSPRRAAALASSSRTPRRRVTASSPTSIWSAWSTASGRFARGETSSTPSRCSRNSAVRPTSIARRPIARRSSTCCSPRPRGSRSRPSRSKTTRWWIARRCSTPCRERV